ncbi:hypothetical protein [Microbacterium sp.]|uniref:hypothetical protein n=1 Tax=Microbacterium sp. TaxID=51671 RepID=UPI003F6EB979
MRSLRGDRYLVGLDAAQLALASALEAPEPREDTVWEALIATLAWLYRTEALEVKDDPDNYYAHRATRHGGQALGGLIYFRGEVEHAHQEHPYRLGWTDPPPTMIYQDGEWVPSTSDLLTAHTRVRMAEVGIDPIRPVGQIHTWVFPSLHADARPDKHHRDTWYAEHVKGWPLRVPLSAAVEYLRER